MAAVISKNKVIREKLKQARSNPLKTYIELTVGDTSRAAFFKYEIITSLFGSTPGGLGFLLRKLFYPGLFKNRCRGVVIGRNVTIRHPGKIVFGDNVAIDDNAVIDAKGHSEVGISLGNEVIINRYCMLKAKTGPINVGKRTSIGSGTIITSYNGVEIGESVIIAGGCSISAGGYNIYDLPSNESLMDQGVYTKGPITIGDDSWIGSGAIILDGITVGKHAVVGAGAVVTKDVADSEIVAGIPARVINRRNKGLQD